MCEFHKQEINLTPLLETDTFQVVSFEAEAMQHAVVLLYEESKHRQAEVHIRMAMQSHLEILGAKTASPVILPIFDKQKDQRLVGFESGADELLSCDVLAPVYEVVSVRDAVSGELLHLTEVLSSRGETAKNSLSLSRSVVSTGVKGDPENLPFWPGGFDMPAVLVEKDQEDYVEATELLKTPPGFAQGMDFDQLSSGKTFESDLNKSQAQPSPLSYSDILLHSETFNLETTQGSTVKGEQGGELPKDQSHLQVAEVDQEDVTVASLDLTASSYQPVASLPSQSTANKYEWVVQADLTQTSELFKIKVPSPAKAWPFELDPFQKQAVMHIEAQENVFVAAHTSAGKTVVAEYAIALAISHRTKIIYTSPLKALSNQKFRDFRETFGKETVGLITGDIQVQVTAPCLIMTTEILRSMLYNGSDVIRDVEWVVFDEVHYISDLERGVVWEETLIMLPEHVSVILLSATVPNALEFADWIGCIKKRKIYVVSTTKRPVPLEHFLYTGFSPKTSDQLFRIVGSDGKFLVEGYKDAMKAKELNTAGKKFISKGYNQERNVWMSLVGMLKKKEKLPVVVFTFSLKRCDSNAGTLTTVDLTDSHEKNYIHKFFMRCISKLKGTDQTLPQVLFMKDLLKRGIAVHHSGILPLLKEIIELLFQDGYVKLLFATETFAIGVNMPARCVVFDATEKYDGLRKRDLHSSEYIQMAGRAGRRGLDSTGTVIMMCKDYSIPESSDLHRMILGKPVQLESKFHVTYSMILNLAKIDTLRIEDLLKRSYGEVDTTRTLPGKEKQLKSVVSELEGLKRKSTSELPHVDRVYSLCSWLLDIHHCLSEAIVDHQSQLRKVLSPGHVLLLASGTGKWEIAVFLKMEGPKTARKLLILLPCEKGEEKLDLSGYYQLQPPDVFAINVWAGLVHLEAPMEWSFTIAEAPLSCLIAFGDWESHVKVDTSKVLEDFRNRKIPRFRGKGPNEHSRNILIYLQSIPTSPFSVLNPVKDLGINEFSFVQQSREADQLRQELSTLRSHYLDPGPRAASFNLNTLFMSHFQLVHQKNELNKKKKELSFAISEDSLFLLPVYKSKEKVLKRLGYLSQQGVVQHKGKVACSLNSHEVFLTEILYDNLFDAFSVEEMVALLSPLVFQQSNCKKSTLTENLQLGKAKMTGVMTSIAEVEMQCGVDTSVEDYHSKFHWGLVEVVHKWALGMTFAEIVTFTDVHEGVIVRCIQRLHELIRSIKMAARVIGNLELHDDMLYASELIQRDIIFAASLYIDQ